MWLRCGAITPTVRSRPISRKSVSPVASNCRMAEPNWKPCVHSVQPRLVYLPPTVKTGAPWAGAQDFSIERILAAESSNSRRTLGASALSAGADCVSTIPRNFSLSAQRQPGFPVLPPMRDFIFQLTAAEFENLKLQFAISSWSVPIRFKCLRPSGKLRDDGKETHHADRSGATGSHRATNHPDSGT